jgi:hypothetical protein
MCVALSELKMPNAAGRLAEAAVVEDMVFP